MAFRCVICGNRWCQNLFPARDRLLSHPGEFYIVQCKGCGCFATVPQLSNDQLSAYYSGYSAHGVVPKVRCEGEGWLACAKSVARRLLAGLAGEPLPCLPRLSVGANVLDIGCSTGTFLATIRDKGWNLYGVEPSARAASVARYVTPNVTCGYLCEAKYPPAFFDLVCAWNVLEHMPDPLENVKEVARILRPDGMFICSVPNAGSWEFRLFRSHWYALDVPRHVVHFTPRTLAALLEKAGLRVKRLRHVPSAINVVMSVCYVLEEKFNAGKPFASRSRFQHSFILKLLLRPVMGIVSSLHHSGRIVVSAVNAGL